MGASSSIFMRIPVYGSKDFFTPLVPFDKIINKWWDIQVIFYCFSYIGRDVLFLNEYGSLDGWGREDLLRLIELDAFQPS